MLDDPAATADPFFRLFPGLLLYPAVALATAATVIGRMKSRRTSTTGTGTRYPCFSSGPFARYRLASGRFDGADSALAPSRTASGWRSTGKRATKS